MGRRSFGSTRKLPSGRYQARYYSPDGRRHSSPGTFVTKADANRWLAKIETEISAGKWQDPARADLTLRAYADAWLSQRTVKGRPLAARTIDTYRHSLDAHILPVLGDRKLSSLTPAMVRTWHAGVTEAGHTAARQAYSTLRAILNTAVADDALARNPCRITGAGSSNSPERPLLDLDAVERLTAAMPEHLQALVSVAFWGALRLGEVVALRRMDVDLVAGTITVTEQQVETIGGPRRTTPKAASQRVVHLPTQALQALTAHLEARPGLPSAPVFTRPDGSQLRHHHCQWAFRAARVKVGLPGVHLHDLRHASLTLTAQLGGTQAELMRRAGHSSTRAAAIYQHAAASRDADLAALLSKITNG